MNKLIDYDFDLGPHTRVISTTSVEAQQWFNSGLMWIYGFNQEEAVTCFQNAVTADPSCAMAHWGIAYAAGPFYNMAWCDFSLAEAEVATATCHAAAQTAKRLKGSATPLEQELIEAINKRFPQPTPATQDEYDEWDDSFANAMRKIYQQNQTDMDIVALFVEAAMTRTPWKLWNYHTGEPMQGSDTLEVMHVLENAMAYSKAQKLPPHPGILHFYIHLVEMSNFPEKGLEAADQLYMLAPDCGHLNHMPGHIYTLVGDYARAAYVSEKAIKADNKYVDHAGTQNFYTTARCHDYHLKMYANMMLGRFKPALDAAMGIERTLTPDTFDTNKPYMVMTMEGYYSMHMHVLVRFGKWQQIIDTPLPDCPDLYCVSTAMLHYAKGVAHAALKQFDEALNEQRLFELACKNLPEVRYFFNNPAIDTLDVARSMLAGELTYHMATEGHADFDVAFDHLRAAVIKCDALYYNEPWAWMHPPRHALGALLLEQGHLREAEQVYRADLGLDPSIPRCMWHPDNVWALHGITECLEKNGDTNEVRVFRQRLTIAQGRADTSVTSSCCCRDS